MKNEFLDLVENRLDLFVGQIEDDVVQTGADLVHQRVRLVCPAGQLLDVLHPEKYELGHVKFDDVRIFGGLNDADRPVVLGGGDRSRGKGAQRKSKLSLRLGTNRISIGRSSGTGTPVHWHLVQSYVLELFGGLVDRVNDVN